MNKYLQVIAVGVALLATGVAAASDGYQASELNTLSHEFKQYTPNILALPITKFRTSIQTPEFHNQSTFSTKYGFDNSYSNNNVELSFHRAFHTIPTTRFGSIGIGAALLNNSSSADYDEVTGPIYLNYTSASGTALILDYNFSANYRLAFIGTNYEYRQAGRTLEQKNNLGFYLSVLF